MRTWGPKSKKSTDFLQTAVVSASSHAVSKREIKFRWFPIAKQPQPLLSPKLLHVSATYPNYGRNVTTSSKTESSNRFSSLSPWGWHLALGFSPCCLLCLSFPFRLLEKRSKKEVDFLQTSDALQMPAATWKRNSILGKLIWNESYDRHCAVICPSVMFSHTNHRCYP